MNINNSLNYFAHLREQLKDRFDYWESDIRDEDVMDFSTYDLADTIQGQQSFKLYRYAPATYYNIRNIEKQQIHLSKNGVFNDLYEGLPCDISGQISSSDIMELGDLAYITCMTETKSNILMWSHYADSNRGLCVEYDLKQLRNPSFEVTKHLFPVIYTGERLLFRDLSLLVESHTQLKYDISQDGEYCGKGLLDDILPLFLTKGMCWGYEQEWRIVYTLKQMYDINNETLYKGTIPFSCISGVYLGYRTDPEVRENIIEICQRLTKETGRRVLVHQAKLSEHGYDISFEPIA